MLFTHIVKLICKKKYLEMCKLDFCLFLIILAWVGFSNITQNPKAIWQMTNEYMKY